MCKINSPIKTQMTGWDLSTIFGWQISRREESLVVVARVNEDRHKQTRGHLPLCLDEQGGRMLMDCQTVTKLEIILNMKFVVLKFCMSLLYLNKDGFREYVTRFCIYLCAGSSWNGATFLHSNSYGFVFQICDQNNADNILIILSIDECTVSRQSLVLSLPPPVNK